VTSLREDTKVNDGLGIKVIRYNSWQRKAKRAFGLEPRTVKANANCKSTSLDLADHTFGCGFLTAQVRRWNSERKQYNDWQVITENQHNLLTNGGRDFFHQQCYKDSGLGTAGTAWVAVTTTAVTPAAGDTTLSGEMTTLGFARALGTYAHTAGTNATTNTVTYTATGTATNVQASGLFNQLAVGGTLSHEATFTATSFVSGDQLGLTWTLNLG